MSSERRSLAVYAHPDDAEIWAGGTLLTHRKAGDHTAICILTHGDGPRAEEAREGATLLGATLYNLSHQDRAVRVESAAIEAVAEVLRAEQPGIILTHWADDSHPDHEATWRVVRAAVLLAEVEWGIQGIFWSDAYNGIGLHGLFEPDTLIDVSGVWEEKIAAIAVHRSQNPRQYIEMMSRQCPAHGARGRVAYAEGFRRANFFGFGPRARASLWEQI